MPLLGFNLDAAKTLVVATSGVAARTGVWPYRSASEITDYWLDFTQIIIAKNGDTLSAVSVTTSSIASVGPSPPQIATDGEHVVLVVRGGVNGDTVTCAITATFHSGSTYLYNATFRIREADGAAAPPTPSAAQVAPATFVIGQVTSLPVGAEPTASFAQSSAGTYSLSLGLPNIADVTPDAIRAAIGGQAALLNAAGTALTAYDGSALTVSVSGTPTALSALFPSLNAQIAAALAAIGVEAARAEAAEGTLSTGVAADASLVSAEAARAESAEQAEVTRAEAAEQADAVALASLGTLTASEASSLTSVGAILTSDGASLTALGLSIGNETSRAEAAEQAEQSAFSTLSSTVSSHGVSLGLLGAQIATEVLRAQAAEQALQASIGSSQGTVSVSSVISALAILPTQLPSISGQLWNNNGAICIS